MAVATNSRQQRLTPDMLECFDDMITDILIDHFYYWTTIRKNHDTYIPYKSVSSEEIAMILRDALQPMHRKERLSKVVLDFTSLPCFRGFYGNLNASEQKHFQQHLRMYIEIYMIDCPFEISSTSRYSSVKDEATVIAREPIRKGSVIKYLCGTRARRTLEEDAKSKEHFSVINERDETTSIGLGPARFLNHECKPNATLERVGHTHLNVRAVRDIQVGEEISVSYGDYYFYDDKGNWECCCKTCHGKPPNKLSPNEACRICFGQLLHNANLECPNCRRNSKIYGHQWPRRYGNSCVERTPRRAVNELEGKEYKSSSVPLQQFNNEMVLLDYSVNKVKNNDKIDDDYFPTLEELLHSKSPRRCTTEEPKKFQNTTLRANSQIFQGISSSNDRSQSSFINFGNCHKRPFIIDDEEQLVTPQSKMTCLGNSYKDPIVIE